MDDTHPGLCSPRFVHTGGLCTLPSPHRVHTSGLCAVRGAGCAQRGHPTYWAAGRKLPGGAERLHSGQSLVLSAHTSQGLVRQAQMVRLYGRRREQCGGACHQRASWERRTGSGVPRVRGTGAAWAGDHRVQGTGAAWAGNHGVRGTGAAWAGDHGVQSTIKVHTGKCQGRCPGLPQHSQARCARAQAQAWGSGGHAHACSLLTLCLRVCVIMCECLPVGWWQSIVARCGRTRCTPPELLAFRPWSAHSVHACTRHRTHIPRGVSHSFFSYAAALFGATHPSRHHSQTEPALMGCRALRHAPSAVQGVLALLHGPWMFTHPLL